MRIAVIRLIRIDVRPKWMEELKMMPVEFYRCALDSSGFQRVENTGSYPPAGLLYRVPPWGEGYYWLYFYRDMFDIKIHDFYFKEDTVYEIQAGEYPECLNIAYYASVSGEELSPYRRLSAGCVKTFFGGSSGLKYAFHKGIPLRSIGIEIFPAYYEQYLRNTYPEEYRNPAEAFHCVDHAERFPKMAALLRQILNFRGEGLSAALFYEAKVSEAISLALEYGKAVPVQRAVSAQDRLLIANAATYIQDHCSADISLEHLSKIACMGTTKLKAAFKAVYHVTITQYIRERRLSYAETLLSTTDFPIEQVAAAVGYRNAGRFAAIFKENCGLYPTEYRRMAREQSDTSK